MIELPASLPRPPGRRGGGAARGLARVRPGDLRFLPNPWLLATGMGRSPAASCGASTWPRPRRALARPGSSTASTSARTWRCCCSGWGGCWSGGARLEAGFFAAHDPAGGDLHGALGGFVRGAAGRHVAAVAPGAGEDGGLTTCSPCRSVRGRRSGCTSICAGWSGARTRSTWASGSAFRRARCSCRWTPTSRGSPGDLGLVRRRTMGWAAAEDITANLRVIDPLDPVRFDFVLCHHGMSGACPARARRARDIHCVLQPECAIGRSLVARRH